MTRKKTGPRKKSEKSEMMLKRIAAMLALGYITATETARLLGIDPRGLPAFVARYPLGVMRVNSRSVFYRLAHVHAHLKAKADRAAAKSKAAAKVARSCKNATR